MVRRYSVRLGIFASSLLVLAATAEAQSPAGGWGKDLGAAQKKARDLDVPLLLHFYADWCGPCRTMERTVLNGAEVGKRLGKTVVGVKLNSDHHKEIVSRYNVRALPCDILVDPNGRELERSEGLKQAFAYGAMLDRAASTHQRNTDAILASSSKPAEKPVAEPMTGTAPKPIEIAPKEEVVDSRPMLDGYSPVALANSREWVSGREEFKVVHKGQTYLLASAEEKAEFDEDPAKFAPRLLGCDPVVLHESDRALAGSTEYGAYFDGSLFLFTSAENRSRFREKPYRYTRTRHVLRASEVTRLQ